MNHLNKYELQTENDNTKFSSEIFSSTKNDSEIHSIQSFSEIIGNNDNLWEILLRKEVTRFNSEVKYRIRYPQEVENSGIEYFNRGRVYAIQPYTKSEFLIEIDYGYGFRVKYKKELFIEQFNKILPSLSFNKVIELVQKEEKSRKLQAERLEAQRQILRKREEERQEAEKRRQEAKRREAGKQTLLRSLKEHFEQNFLNTFNFYQTQCLKHISFDEYQAEKSEYVRSWIQRHLKPNDLPDFEQAAAIGAIEGHIQVVARAGSGKTSTLVNRALFLQKHCGIAPSEMLLLAFNRKAAEEIQERLTSQLQSSIPHVMTFHALAYALVHPEENILFNEPDGEQSKSHALQDVIDGYLHNPDCYEEIRVLMMAHFREDWERIVLGGYDRSPEEMLRYRRSLSREGLDGTYLKSFGEKAIADFLFEHDIKYRYERNFWWNGINYRPDFTIENNQGKRIVIEYFGLEGDPDYDAMSERKRNYWQNNPEWHLLEFSPRELKSSGVEGFRALLKQSLKDLGITCLRLSEEEIWQRIKNRAIDRFTKTVVGFIQRCRKQSLTPEELAKLVDRHHCSSDVEQRFLDLAQKFYQSYRDLNKTGEGKRV